MHINALQLVKLRCKGRHTDDLEDDGRPFLDPRLNASGPARAQILTLHSRKTSTSTGKLRCLGKGYFLRKEVSMFIIYGILDLSPQKKAL